MKINSTLFLMIVAGVAVGTLIALYVTWTIAQKQIAATTSGSTTGRVFSLLSALQGNSSSSGTGA